MSATSPKVSVVIPVYNCEKYIAEAVDSVLNQTYRDFELIVVNDGSTDGTGKILDTYKGLIRRIDQTNQGRSSARNNGIKAACGEFIAFLDSDDFWRPRKLEHQVPLMEKSEATGVVFTNTELFMHEDGSVVGDYFSARPPRRGKITTYLIHLNCSQITSVMVRKNLAGEELYFSSNYTLAEDFDLLLRLSAVCEFDYVEEPMARYRVHLENSSRDATRQLSEVLDIIRNFRKTHPDIAERAAGEFLKAEGTWEKRLAFACLTAGKTAEARRLYLKLCRSNPLLLKYWAIAFLTLFGTAPFHILGVHGRDIFLTWEGYEKEAVRVKRSQPPSGGGATVPFKKQSR